MHIKSKKNNIFIWNIKKMFRKDFSAYLKKWKKNQIRFDIFMQFGKKIANFEVNIAKNRQITKLIDEWGKNLQKSQQK